MNPLVDNSLIPVVIFCGGSGTRLREETHNKPKPMVDVGGKPLLWHVIKIYQSYGFKRFVLALGYKGDYIVDFFRNGNGRIFGDCQVDLVDTGEATPHGGRLLKVSDYLPGDLFMVTYGDGLSDVDILKVLRHHLSFGDQIVGTITIVKIPHKFGIVTVSPDGRLGSYQKGHPMNEPINAGFMVFNRSFLDHLNETMMIEDPFDSLAKQGKLAAYYHDGYFGAVDTYKDLEDLNQEWQSGPRWKVWPD